MGVSLKPKETITMMWISVGLDFMGTLKGKKLWLLGFVAESVILYIISGFWGVNQSAKEQ